METSSADYSRFPAPRAGNVIAVLLLSCAEGQRSLLPTAHNRRHHKCTRRLKSFTQPDPMHPSDEASLHRYGEALRLVRI